MMDPCFILSQDSFYKSFLGCIENLLKLLGYIQPSQRLIIFLDPISPKVCPYERHNELDSPKLYFYSNSNVLNGDSVIIYHHTMYSINLKISVYIFGVTWSWFNIRVCSRLLELGSSILYKFVTKSIFLSSWNSSGDVLFIGKSFITDLFFDFSPWLLVYHLNNQTISLFSLHNVCICIIDNDSN